MRSGRRWTRQSSREAERLPGLQYERASASARAVVPTSAMNALKAHVENGRIIVDEPTDLPDGTTLHVVPIKDDPELDAEERERILRAIDEGQAAAGRGEHVDAEEF